MPNLRLAVLLCDEFIISSPGNVAEYISYYFKTYHQFLAESLAEIISDVTFTLDGYDVVNDMTYPSEGDHYDGILISGSRASVNEDLPWLKKLLEYTKHTITGKASIKVFGICFGYQVICKALGGTVKKGEWEVSVTTINLSSIGKAIFRTSELHLQELHHDQVTEHPPHAHLLGSSDHTHSQGIVIFDPALAAAPLPADLNSDVKLTSIQVLALQAHPEFTEFFVRRTLNKISAYLPQDLVEDANARVGLPTDAISKVGRVIWEVLGVTSEC